MENSIDVMVDLETCGISAGCIILSIGACTFDMKHKFYTRISEKDSANWGFHYTPSTMAWWNKQDVSVRDEAFSGTSEVLTAIGQFSDWFNMLKRMYKNVYIWGNGADFDLPILSEYYISTDMKIPWEPFNGRCYRTLKNLYKDVKISKNEMKHNALNDAVTQADHAIRILREHFTKFQD